MGAVHNATIPAIPTATIIYSPNCTSDNNLPLPETYIAKIPDSNPNPLLSTLMADNAKNG